MMFSIKFPAKQAREYLQNLMYQNILSFVNCELELKCGGVFRKNIRQSSDQNAYEKCGCRIPFFQSTLPLSTVKIMM
jgi:hypothetical protein